VYGRLEPAALKHRSTARPHFSYIRDPKLANKTLAHHGPTVKNEFSIERNRPPDNP
jgi:hypothetical protein